MSHYNKILTSIKDEGLYKSERTLTTPQGVEVETENGNQVLNFCANNYLGLANHSKLIDAAKSAMDDYGFGMASVRFICGTQDLHKTLEKEISIFLKPMIPFCIHHASMQMEDYSKPYSMRTMRSYLIH